MNVEIIATGSGGNAVIIDDCILIDCGVPFKALTGYHKGLQLVLLTHLHGDHFSRATIKRLGRERPTLRFGCCEWLVAPLLECGVSKENIDVYEPGGRFRYGNGVKIEPVSLPHNEPNCGYKLNISGQRGFYATDTNSLDGIEAKNYDLYMVEANYTEEEIVERIRAKLEAGAYCHEWDALQNHLSREKANDWLYKNMGPDSRYVYLHGHEGLDRGSHQ